MNVLTQKIREVSLSVIPITIIVLLLNFTIAPLETPMIIRFLIGAFLIIIGLSIFLFGIDIGITPFGNSIGSSITKSNKTWLVAAAGIVLGFFVAIAEPNIRVLADQIEDISSKSLTSSSIVLIVSIGIATMIAIGLIRIVKNISLRLVLIGTYLTVFILSLFVTPEFFAIAFDSSGASTGALTVPFILALSVGVSSIKKDSKSSEDDSFGLVGVSTTGPVIAVMLMYILTKNIEFSDTSTFETSSLPFLKSLSETSFQVFIALIPIFIMFMVAQFTVFKMHKKLFNKILKGILYTFIGLVLFLVGVNTGFMDVGKEIGSEIVSSGYTLPVVIVGFILGLVTILAEPAVYVLTHQIEDVTSGYVSRKSVILTLSIGVGVAVALSMLRILVPQIQLWHYLLPGYLISIAMTFFVPKLFIGMAFDSGAVASGPMAATFILAFAQGVASATEGADVLIDGFGIISMVALTPVLAIQILGLIFKIKSRKEGIVKNES